MRSDTQQNRFQLGNFWLDQRPDSPFWYIYWCEKKGKRYRTCRHSTGERDFAIAQECLAKHFLTHVALEDATPTGITIAFVLDRDFEKYGKNLASRDTVASAIAKWKEFWGLDATVEDLRSEDRQKEFIGWLEKQTAHNTKGDALAPATVRRQLNVGRTAFIRSHHRHEISAVPYVMTYKGYTGDDSGDARRERILSLEEMAGLFDAAANREHMWRYMVLMVGSGARPGGPLEIGPAQVDLSHARLNLLPSGKKQTKKRRPIVPVCPTLLTFLKEWTAKENLAFRSWRGEDRILDRLVTYRGKRIKSVRDSFREMKAEAGIDDPEVVPYSIRHTIATWLAEKDVPDRELELFMGHRLPGNATTSRYIHLKPGYLRHAAAAVEAYFTQLEPLVKRALRPSRAPVATGSHG